MAFVVVCCMSVIVCCLVCCSFSFLLVDVRRVVLACRLMCVSFVVDFVICIVCCALLVGCSLLLFVDCCCSQFVA